MDFLTNIFDRFKKGSDTPSLIPFYDEKKRKIKFTNKGIYEYLKECIGYDLEYYALNYFGKRITYAELFRNVEKVSFSLLNLGVQKEDIVSICMPNTPEAIYAFYAINNIGAVADMIHPLSAPLEVKDYLIKSQSRIIILFDENFQKYKKILDELNLYKVVLVSAVESLIPIMQLGYRLIKNNKTNWKIVDDDIYLEWKTFLNLGNKVITKHNIKVSSKDLAVILHSGGTTGKSKGIMLSNFNFNAETQQDAVNVINIKPKDKILTVVPIFHGFGLTVCVNCPLTLKVEVILMPKFNNKEFYKLIKKYRPNVLAGVPSLWENMLNDKKFNNIDLSFLKYIISGGDHLPIKIEDSINTYLENHNAKIKISKGYGMTESVAATVYTFEKCNKVGSIGVPMIGNKVMICNPDTNDKLKNGAEGEICVSGPTIMMGYLNDDEETKKVLIKHRDGKIWLHTGDIGYINNEGLLFFTQRRKRIIVSSGFNLYPSIIEEVILKHEKVTQCAVVGIPDKHKMKVIKAYVVLKNGEEENIKIKAEIKILCRNNLPLYSQPKYVKFVNNLPLTLYNKIDYKKLEEENSRYEEK